MESIIKTLLGSLLSFMLFTWGQNGHRIVAEICYDNLDENVSTKVDKILGDNYLAQVATWPDFIRSEKAWDFVKPWHFMTINTDKSIEQVIEEGKKNPDIENVAEAIELMKAILKNDNNAIQHFEALMDSNSVKPLDGSTQLTALAFLVHFIGDIHQPMHVGKNKDHGGNKISVLFFSDDSNLHSVWDSGIIEKEKLSFTEFAKFIQIHTSNQKKAWENAPIDEWVNESIAIREKIYNTLYDKTDRDSGLPDMSYNYQHDFLPVVEQQLGAAGYRTAAILNDILK